VVSARGPGTARTVHHGKGCVDEARPRVGHFAHDAPKVMTVVRCKCLLLQGVAGSTVHTVHVLWRVCLRLKRPGHSRAHSCRIDCPPKTRVILTEREQNPYDVLGRDDLYSRVTSATRGRRGQVSGSKRRPGQASTARLFPYGRGGVGNRGVASRPSTQEDRRAPHSKSRRGKAGATLNGSAALVEAP
jgi:hypothetical protein